MTWRLLFLVANPRLQNPVPNVERLGPNVSPRFEELDSAQTSSCEDARRWARRGVWIHKALAVLHLAGVEKSDYFSKIIHKDR